MKKGNLPCKICKVNLYDFGKASCGGIRCTGCGHMNTPEKRSKAFQEFMFWKRNAESKLKKKKGE